MTASMDLGWLFIDGTGTMQLRVLFRHILASDFSKQRKVSRSQ